jgi:predicted PhzF superfamily epimerase YddE/YHI9
MGDTDRATAGFLFSSGYGEPSSGLGCRQRVSVSSPWVTAMTIPLFHVDAFTDKPFAGNPAAVCILSDQRPDAWMQQVGAEMNLSETAFVQKQEDGFRLRWFTPKVEVDLCGHATLASAHVLWQEGHARPDEIIRFYTRSGVLTAGRNAGLIELDFPLIPEEPAAAPPGLVEALGVPFEYVGKGRFDYLVEVDSEATLRNLASNFHQLASLPIRGLIVTSKSSRPEFDFVSRFFAPGAGIDEDPVTGSAHCCLAAYWRKHLHKDSFVAYQASARGGVVRVRVSGDRAILGGQAMTVSRGVLLA